MFNYFGNHTSSSSSLAQYLYSILLGRLWDTYAGAPLTMNFFVQQFARWSICASTCKHI